MSVLSPRPPSSSPARPAGLTIVATLVGLLAALWFLPPLLAAGWPGSRGTTIEHLGGDLPAAMTRWWTSNDPVPDDELAALVTFWSGFHAVKAVLAALLLVAAGGMAARLLGACVRADRPAHLRTWGTAGFGCLLLAMIALLVLIANVQGAWAPLSSAVSLLPTDGSNADLASAAAGLHQQLLAGTRTPPLTTLVEDFRRYHLVLAICSALSTVLLFGGLVSWWRRRARVPRAQRRPRRVIAAVAVLLAGLMLFLALITLANMSTAADPAPALAGFLDSVR